MEFKNTFVGGKMDKDLDERLLPKGQYRHAENINVIKSEGSEVGAVENVLGNKKLTDYNFGANPKTIGAISDVFDDKIYWWVLSDSGSFVMEYDTIDATYTLLLHDTRATGSNILNLNELYLITGANVLINSDDDSRFLAWTDDLNPPRFINIERAKTYGENGFGDAEISLIKSPPLAAPVINLSDTPSDIENNIEEKFLRFAIRYQYLDGEYSALSSFSEIGFLPKSFLYDYSTATNESMVNNFSQIDVSFSAGGSLVKSVDVVYKESGNNLVYLIESFNKEKEGWVDDQSVSFEFSNNKLYKVLASTQLSRLFDAVPLKAKAQEMIGNRLIFGNYTESYDIVDSTNTDIKIDYSISKVSTAIVEGTPTTSMRSNRDYEIGVVYMDTYGRMTTVLTSQNNTLHIANPDCINQNEIKVTMVNVAPAFASKFRFFIKQSKTDYESITPTIFYEDGIYVWIKLEGGEINKITEGEFLYVKSDTQEILTEVKQTKVLEIVAQEWNFLELPAVTETMQLEGTYFKIKPSGFRMSESDFQNYNFTSYDSSSNANDNPIRGEVNVIEPASYYGLGGLNDLTQSGAYVGSDDIRYQIEIDATGTPDTFRWSDDDGSTWTSTVAITGGAQTLNNGVDITFGATTGHAITDTWIVSAKSATDDGFGSNESSKAYAIFKSVESNTNINIDDVIEGGAQITIIYDEYNETVERVEETYISSRKYDNLEEWWFGDNIQDTFSIVDTRIWFRRGTATDKGGAKYFTQTTTDDMCLIIKSSGTQNNDLDDRVKIKSTLSIFQSDQNVIFETKPVVENTDIYNEIGRTYDIDASGYHLGFDGSDTDQTAIADGVFILPSFNCYAWGNGFESYKIRDSFNETSFKLDTRPSSTVEDYRENHRRASLTYGEVYEQSTNYNGINEFNLSTANFKDLDDKYNSIQKLYTEDTNIIVFQEDKVHNVLFQKDVLFDADGSGNIRQTSTILGQEVPYLGEYGISKNPESFDVFGSRKYFTDVKRGCLIRLSNDGITKISNNGMLDWFKDTFRALPNTKKLGAYDVYTDQYVLHLDDTDIPETTIIPCGSDITAFELGAVKTITYELGAIVNSVELAYTIVGTVDLVIRDDSGVLNTLNGLVDVTSTQTVTRVDTDSNVYLDVTPVSTNPTVTFNLPCPIAPVDPVVAEDDLLLVITGTVVDNINVLYNDTFVDPVTVLITTPPVEGTAIVNPNKTIKYTHDGLNTNADTLIYNIDDGATNDSADLDFNVKATGGGGGATGEAFSISTDSYFNPAVDGEGACGFVLDDTKYHDGALLDPIIGDNVFIDINKTTPFNGGDKYYRISNGIAIRIFTDGSITGYWVCGAGEA